MRRVIVGGISGAGKTTLAREIARRRGLPFTEVDSLFHGPGWTKREGFRDRVDAITRTDRWVLDSSGYSSVQDLLWSRADTVVWLDLPRWQIMPRVIRRSVWRAITREELWNGNVESARNFVRADHPIRWAWSQHGPRRLRTEGLVADPRYRHLTVVRLRTAREIARWRASI